MTETPNDAAARLLQEDKSKEIDSGVVEWETPVGVVVEPAPVPVVGPVPVDETTPPAAVVVVESPPVVAAPAPVPSAGPSAVLHNEDFLVRLAAWQHAWPRSVCIFVGNLPHLWADAELSYTIWCMFSLYGDCAAAVRRLGTRNGLIAGPPGMPYAHVQFNNPVSAQHAVQQVAGPHQIGHRTLRTEMKRLSNRPFRSIVVSRAMPQPEEEISILFLVEHLRPWGMIVSAEPTNMLDVEDGLQSGTRIRFEFQNSYTLMYRAVGRCDIWFHYRYEM